MDTPASRPHCPAEVPSLPRLSAIVSTRLGRQVGAINYLESEIARQDADLTKC